MRYDVLGYNPMTKIPYKDLPEEVKERRREANRKWNRNNREKALANRRKREAGYRQDPVKLARKRESDRRVWKKRKNTARWLASTRKSHLKAKYGITPKQYDEMLKKHNGVCAICEQPETASRAGKIKLLSVDHNHTSNQIRGLLCDRCNKAIGHMHDNIERLQSAIEYLKRYSEEK
jgi:hypothetical protein